MPYFIDILAFHLNDEYSQISLASRSCLNYLAHSNLLSLPIISTIKENLYKIFNTLPRLTRGTNEIETLMSMKLIVGYITLLGATNEINTLVQSTINHISIALFQIIDFDIIDSRQDAPNSSVLNEYPKKIFKNFRDNTLIEHLSKVCRLLGYYSNPIFIIQYYLNVIQDINMSKYLKQAIFVLNEVILGNISIYYIKIK